MRNLLSGLLLALTLTAPALSSPEVAHLANLEEDVLGTQKPSTVTSDPSSESKESKDDPKKSTVFNGITVPPMHDFKGPDFEEEAKDGYWYGLLCF